MTILDEFTKTSPIILLWVWTIILSVETIIITFINGGFKYWWNFVISLFVVTVGIVGVIFWTPEYRRIQVYADEKFSISQIEKDYNIISVDGLIVTLEPK